MSWLFSQALVEEYLGANFLDGEQSVPLNGKPIPQAYCALDKMTKFSKVSQYGMTFKPLMESLGQELLTSFLAAFHAKTSVQSAKAQASRENDQECGEKWHGWLAKYDQNSCLWRTAQCSLIEDLNESLVTLPRSGMTRDGLLWEQETLGQTIKETEFGLLGKLPTPLASDWKKYTKNKEYHLKRNWDLPNKLVQLGHPPTKNGHWGAYHPVLSESMMLWPLGWTELKPLEMDKSHFVQQQHGESSQKDN
jgi:hypothetical protein